MSWSTPHTTRVNKEHILMKNTGRFRAWAKLFTASLLLIQGYAWGECHFGQDGEGGTSTIVNTIATSPVYFNPSYSVGMPSHYTEIAGPFEAQLSPALWSDCDSGSDGAQMSNITYDAVGSQDGYALWPTNVESIFYAVRVYSDNNTGSYFKYSPTQWADLSVAANQPSKNWKVQIKLFQLDYFTGNREHVSAITPKGSLKIGGMSIGGHTSTDNQPWWFNITPSSFSIPVAAATCQTAMVNGGSNNVDFGDVMFSQVRNGWFPHQTFNLQFRGCSNTVGIFYKVSSNKTVNLPSGARLLLANTLTTNAANGIGIELNQEFPANPAGHGEPFINDPTLIYAPFPEVGVSTNIDLPFTAYLMTDSSQMTPGDFKAVATFTIEYL
ncbi:hypothetical protein FNO19_02630 [Salmonella enterica subsp. salamae]|nr:hypothetical protein [Salmonella enterica subsp. salamae]